MLLAIHMLNKVMVGIPMVRAKPEDYRANKVRPKVCVIVWTRLNIPTKKDAVKTFKLQHQMERLDRPNVQHQLEGYTR